MLNMFVFRPFVPVVTVPDFVHWFPCLSRTACRSGMGTGFRSSFALGFDSGAPGWPALGFMMGCPSVFVVVPIS